MLAADQHREDRINILYLTLSQQPRALLQEELGTFAYLDCHNQSASTQEHSLVGTLHINSKGLVVVQGGLSAERRRRLKSF